MRCWPRFKEEMSPFAYSYEDSFPVDFWLTSFLWTSGIVVEMYRDSDIERERKHAQAAHQGFRVKDSL